MGKKEKRIPGMLKSPWFPVVFFCLVVVLTTVDIGMDVAAGTTLLHVLIESLIVLGAVAGAVYFWSRLRISWLHEQELEHDLRKARVEMANWQAEQSNLLEDLRSAIERQFTQWDFSPSEKEIAFYLLKGLSMKDIATLKDSTPRSITQQAYVLYHKAGLGGRAELSAYFLDALVQGDPMPETPAANKET